MTPIADRPHMAGYGLPEPSQGLLPWSWATERLLAARNYWLATVRPDGRSHAMPVWGIWLADHCYFSTGKQSRKARNLAENPNCVVHIERGDEAVIVEGVATLLADPIELKRFAQVYGPKYGWEMENFSEPVYIVRPTVVFGFNASGDQFMQTATRWVFADHN